VSYPASCVVAQTFVEALGFPNDQAYMAKAHLKMKLAARLGIPMLIVTHSDTRDLASIFSKWLPRALLR
jgi:hypothetical protein